MTIHLPTCAFGAGEVNLDGISLGSDSSTLPECKPILSADGLIVNFIIAGK